MNVSVPISIGLPILVVGGFLVFTAAATGRTLFWVLGLAGAAVGVLLLASGKRL